MSDTIIEKTIEHHARLRAELAKVDKFLQMAERLSKDTDFLSEVQPARSGINRALDERGR